MDRWNTEAAISRVESAFKEASDSFNEPPTALNPIDIGGHMVSEFMLESLQRLGFEQNRSSVIVRITGQPYRVQKTAVPARKSSLISPNDCP
jgi:hypothetical protein